ncbi:MAG: fatty acid desaturase, partial [Arenimonas sp.]
MFRRKPLFRHAGSAGPPGGSLVPSRRGGISSTLRRWFDTDAAPGAPVEADGDVDWLRAAPFVAMHFACLAVFVVGVSPFAIAVAAGLYAVRMFALTGFYHRYFSHRTFRASRAVQFAFAVIGAASVQRGPLWWAAHHRNHHRHVETTLDLHSPVVHGFWRSHVGWFLTRQGFRTEWDRVGDLAKFPELRWLDRFDIAVPVALAIALYALG